MTDLPFISTQGAASSTTGRHHEGRHPTARVLLFLLLECLLRFDLSLGLCLGRSLSFDLFDVLVQRLLHARPTCRYCGKNWVSMSIRCARPHWSTRGVFLVADVVVAFDLLELCVCSAEVLAFVFFVFVAFFATTLIGACWMGSHPVLALDWPE